MMDLIWWLMWMAGCANELELEEDEDELMEE